MSIAKTQRLELRLTEEQNTLIRSAATYTSRSISDIVHSAAPWEAERRLADQRFFILNEGEHARFEEILAASPTDDPQLRKLFERPSPFGTHIDLNASSEPEH